MFAYDYRALYICIATEPPIAGSKELESISSTKNKEGRGISGISQDENVGRPPDVQDGQYGYRDDEKKYDQTDSEDNNKDQRDDNSEEINQGSHPNINVYYTVFV